MWQIRRGREEDYDAVTAIWEATGLGAPTDDEWRAITIGSGARLLVSVEEGAVIGTSVVAFDGWRAYIYHIAVHPQHQRKGIAHALMAEAERHVRHEGGRRMFAFVNGENTAGMAVLGTFGYESEGDVAFFKELA